MKRVLLGVTGGIAAYKAASLAGMLKKDGYTVECVMTKNAQEFITPLTMQTLTGTPVFFDSFTLLPSMEVEHIALAKRADILVIAPATANIIGKVASGIADDLLTTVIMATKKPVYFAPAMNTAMWENTAVQENIALLKRRGYHFIEPESGMLACGDVGKGRMAEPEVIRDVVSEALTEKDLQGKRIMVTAGPTREPLDAVRFISNYSSGKMGYAIAKAARNRGAEVTLVSGPTVLEPIRGVTHVPVESAQEMYEAVMSRRGEADCIIKSAAVGDFRPQNRQDRKIKTGEMDTITLEKNPHILTELGKDKKYFLVGFCMETDNLEGYAKEKLEQKGADMIVANSLREEGAGFGGDTNIVTVFYADGSKEHIERMSKWELGNRLLDRIRERMP